MAAPTFTSPGAAISQRQALEAALAAGLDEEMPRFFEEVAALALEPNGLTPIAVEELWAATAARVQSRAESHQNEVIAALAVGVGTWLLLLSSPVDAYQSARGAVEIATLTGEPLTVLLREAFSPDAMIPGLSDGTGATWQTVIDSAARTTATKQYNQSALDYLTNQGYTHKMWLSRRDHRVRPTHVEADSQIQPIHDYFTVGFDQLKYPADPHGTAAETAGCRCVIVGLTAVAFPERN